jgi:hypothetical protein
MVEALVPKWIKAEESQKPFKRAKEDGSALLAIRLGGFKFWREFLKNAAINVECLSRIELRGIMSDFESDPAKEQRCRIDVIFPTLRPNATFTDLFYVPGSSLIRTLTLEGDSLNYELCVLPDEQGIGVLAEDEAKPIDAEAMADRVVKAAAHRVRQ